jgi:hypothetical protein
MTAKPTVTTDGNGSTPGIETVSGLNYGKAKPGVDLITRTIDNADCGYGTLAPHQDGPRVDHHLRMEVC